MAEPYDDFWTASRLTTLTQRALGARVAAYQAPAGTIDPLELPTPPHPLTRRSDRLARILRNRRSVREFGNKSLRAADLGALLAPLAVDDGRRSYPSAGGLYPLRCYPVLLDVAHPLNGAICRYDHQRHALQRLGSAPPWEQFGPVLTARPDSAPPQLVLLFVLTDAEVIAKYGQRGGRFGLIEAGCASQSVAIRLAERGLGGYLLGAGADGEVLRLLGLAHGEARFALAMACGRLSGRARRPDAPASE